LTKRSYDDSLALDWDCTKDDEVSAEVDTAVASAVLGLIVDVQRLTLVSVLDTADSSDIQCRSTVDGTCSIRERKDSILIAFVLMQ
jgi:hypothetical protein